MASINAQQSGSVRVTPLAGVIGAEVEEDLEAPWDAPEEAPAAEEQEEAAQAPEQ